MFVRIILLLLILVSITIAQTEPICMTADNIADSLLQKLPRDSSSYATIGILYANKVFLRKTDDGKRDADSAVFYITRALSYVPTPRMHAYACIARVLRATKDNAFTQVFGGTKTRATQAFDECDSIARNNQNDLGVQFLTANLFQEGDKLNQKKYYWQRAWDIFNDLLALETDTNTFFTAEVRGNILLNQGKLVHKLCLYGNASDAQADTLWQRTIRQYPHTIAAQNAKQQRNQR